MSHYSDPTANRALGAINREFSRLEKKANALCRRLDAGDITEEDFQKAQRQFSGIYRHVLRHVRTDLEAQKARQDAGQKPAR